MLECANSARVVLIIFVFWSDFMDLYDYIYIDLDKVVSVYSQLTGGVVELREAVSEATNNQDNKRKYDLKVFKHEAGGTEQDKQGIKEIIKPYHSFLSELEEELTSKGHMVDLSLPECKSSLKDENSRKELKNTFCIKVTGQCVLEDYERIKSISEVFPDIVKMINKSNEHTLKNSTEYQSAFEQIVEAEKGLKKITNNNEKTKKRNEIKEAKQILEETLSNTDIVGGIEQWILDALKTWIDSFLKNIINIRIYPNKENTDTHIFGNLKEDCFCDTDSNAFHFTYGSMPTEDITLIGLVTSVPMEKDEVFNPLAEFDKSDEELDDSQGWEKVLRNLFRGFDGFEQMVRTCRYPRILVYPLLVYRKSSPKKLST